MTKEQVRQAAASKVVGEDVMFDDLSERLPSKVVADAEAYLENRELGIPITEHFTYHITAMLQRCKELTQQRDDIHKEYQDLAAVTTERIASLEGALRDMDFQSGCSWCEKNISIATQALDGGK